MDHKWWRNSAIKEGREIGIKEGIKEGKKEVAKSLIKEKMPIEKIISITGLSKEEIEELQ